MTDNKQDELMKDKELIEFLCGECVGCNTGCEDQYVCHEMPLKHIADKYIRKEEHNTVISEVGLAIVKSGKIKKFGKMKYTVTISGTLLKAIINKHRGGK